MNIMELKAKVDAAIANGIDPNTTVVIGDYAGDWGIVDVIHDPTDPDTGCLWFTLCAHEEADGRFTPGHYPEEPVC